MSKLHKVTVYIIDDDDMEEFEIDNAITSKLNATMFEYKVSKEFEWQDNIAINYTDCLQSDFENVLNNIVDYREDDK